MDVKLLSIAALAAALALPASAGAQQAFGNGMHHPHSSNFGRAPSLGDLGQCSNVNGGHGRHDRGTVNCYGGWAYADGEWAYSNNRSWDSNSYNDWWNDRPDRAFPRWVQEQHGGPCEPDRMWWSGTGWHC